MRTLEQVKNDRTGARKSKQKLYNCKQWRALRAWILKKQPLCIHCKQQGRVTAATVVDHITPHGGSERLFWDESNLQGLCQTCHNIKSRGEQ